MEIDLTLDLDAGAEERPKSLKEKWWLAPTDAEARAKLRKRNLAAFQQKYPTVYAQIATMEPKSELVFDDNGIPDMKFRGTLFYDGDIEGFTKRQMFQYWRNPNRLSVHPPTPQSMDSHASRCVFAFMRRMTEDLGARFAVGRSEGDSFYGMIMGLGLGPHLPEFIERSGCRNLFILEPNLEGFYHSMDILDWQAILLEMQDRNGDIFFFLGGHPQAWMDHLRFQTRATNPISLDGLYVYHHYNNSQFTEFSKKFNKESQLLITGLGFFYDEQIMIRNTYDNLVGHDSRIYLRGEKPPVQKIPAIIVGCGPSLDENIEDIKRNADNAVIFSSGSALGPLMNAGIRPDFQLELENLGVVRVIRYAADRHDLSGICLVASSTVDREIKQYFNETVYWFRPALCPYPIFSNNTKNCLMHPDPTVVNVALSFAQEMGFREYYFFGADMGQKDNNRHHSESSYHYTDVAKNDLLQTFNIEVPANFGGKSRTSSGLFWALDTLQRAISYTSPSIKYYNCSNGARINRAVPKLSRTLNLPKPEVSRAEAVKAIIDNFPVMTQADFEEKWQPERIIDAFNGMCDELIDIVDTSDFVRGTDHLVEFARLFYATKTSPYEHFSAQVLRGTINQVFIAADYYLCRLSEEELFEPAMEVLREEFRIMVDRLREIETKHLRARDLGIELNEKCLSGESDDDGLTDEQREMLLTPPA